MINRRALRASAFHFLFHAEGRVTPGRGWRFGTEAYAGGRLEFLLLWPDGRVTPGWVFCLVTFAWRALGALGAATTRSPDGIPCEGPLYVVPKHPSRWRRDPWGFNFSFFRRWVARALGRVGVGCAAGPPPGSQVDDEVTLPGLRYPVRKPRSSISRRYSRRRYRCPVGLAIAERWVARALGPVGVGS